MVDIKDTSKHFQSTDAEAQGKSLNSYINDLIDTDMAKTALCDDFVADGHGGDTD